MIAIATLVALPAAAIADERPPARKPTVALTLPTTGMAEVRQPFRVAVTPTPEADGIVAALQVQSPSGFVTQQRVALDRRGKASGLVVSNRPAVRTYRAVLLSARGRVLAASPSVTVTWAPLTYSPTLSCARSDAPVNVDIPCTITVTPTVRLDDVIASLQVMGRTEWVPLEAVRVPRKGIVRTHVAGLEPGVGMYRVLLLRDAEVIAESPSISITYSTSTPSTP